MSELTQKDLHWFHLANANAATGFYDFKKRFLKRFASQEGWDLQRIEKECWRCDGTGIYGGGPTLGRNEECRACAGSGVYRTDEHWLQRWVLAGHVYHVPEFCSPPHHERDGKVHLEITGRIQHEPVEAKVARRAFYRLLLRHEPVTFWRRVKAEWISNQTWYRYKLMRCLVRLRNRLDLFPAVPEVREDDVPF